MRGVKLLDPSGVLVVETALGHDDVMSVLDAGTLTVKAPPEEQPITGHFAVASVQNGHLAWTFVEKTGRTR